jgi:DNA polymerase-3 subunit delta'
MSLVRLADVLGHDAAVAELVRVIVADRVPPAVLLLGPAGIGKRALADALAARLLCTAGTDDACGLCPQCTRIAGGTHPDLRVVVRDPDRKDVRTEQIRELTRWLSLTPLMATRKVGIVDGAHEVNEHGQNALLKTLEEPPGRTVLLLTASAPSLLLPTVRSRCRQVRLDPLPAALVRRVIEARGIEGGDAEMLASLAEGSPGRAMALAGDDEKEARQSVLETLPVLRTLDAADISKRAQELARGAGEAGLAVMLAWYRDVLGAALLGTDAPLRLAGHAAEVRAAAGRLDAGAVLRQLEAVCDTIRDIERNANRTLAIETLLLWLRQLERDDPAVRTTPAPWTNIT